MKTTTRAPCFEVGLKEGVPYSIKAQERYLLRLHHCASADLPSSSAAAPPHVTLLCSRGRSRTTHHLCTLTAAQHGAPLKLTFPGSVAFTAVGGPATLFLSWNLKEGRVPPEYDPSDSEVEENESDLPVLGEKTCLWTNDPVFGGPAATSAAGRRKQKRDRAAARAADAEADDDADAPALIAAERVPASAATGAGEIQVTVTPQVPRGASERSSVDDSEAAADGEPPAKRAKTATVIDNHRTLPGSTSLNVEVTPPRMLALVPSSSPERSASSGMSDEGSQWSYAMRVPDLPSKAETPPSMPILPVRQPQGDTKTVTLGDVKISTTPLPPPSDASITAKADEANAESKPAGNDATATTTTVHVCPSPSMKPRAVPKGVLKRRSRLLQGLSPRHAPAPSPRQGPVGVPSPRLRPKDGPKGPRVQWNPKSPDIRFITPPMSAIHRAFSGGLLDLGVPTLSHMSPSVKVTSTNADGSKGQPLSGLARGGSGELDSDSQSDVPPYMLRYGNHRPHAPTSVTPARLRPAVID